MKDCSVCFNGRILFFPRDPCPRCGGYYGGPQFEPPVADEEGDADAG